jgi:putative heme-binding domain-containing protein
MRLRPLWVYFIASGTLIASTFSSAFVKFGLAAIQDTKAKPSNSLFARDNLIAWCIVPFDSKKRGPEDRAAMLEKLGFKHFAYDWRAEHIPTFDAEIESLKRHGVALDAFWVAPGELNRESRLILDALKRHGVHAQLWALLDLGADRVTGAEQQKRVATAAAKLKPLAEEAEKIGCSLALYNHGGWFGEPENQIAIIERLKGQGVANVGIVYNLHHGHDHLDRFAALLAKMKPYLRAINLNGMDPGGDRFGRKILQLGQGSLDLSLLRTIRDSGYNGPIGILGHTQDDAEERLRDNLDGLDWLVPQLDGAPAGPPLKPRTPVPPRPSEPPKTGALTPAYDPARVTELIHSARAAGDPERGAEVFASAKFGCLSCHRVGTQGGTVGPDLTTAGICLKPEEITESVLWPRRIIKEGYAAISVATADGRIRQGFRRTETEKTLELRDLASGESIPIAKAEIEEIREDGSVMPEGLAEAMTADQRRDVIRFLLDLGRPGGLNAADLGRHIHTPAQFTYDRGPLRPDFRPSWQSHVNRERLYDFYAKEAAHFLSHPEAALLPAFPGLDGGRDGHWGNQNEDVWADDRWNQTEVGTLLCGVFRGAGVTVPKGVCVRLGERGELAVCFNPETLSYEALWTGGFVKFSPKRHGFLDGLIMDGTPQPRPPGTPPNGPFTYRGFYRHGKRVVFAYRLGDVEMLDAPWVENGQFTRVVAPATEHPLAALTCGGAPQWPQVIETRGTLGRLGPYAIDTIDPPSKNPWNALMFFGDHDFMPNGTAMICTMQGDVWHVEGLDAALEHVRWRRYASGLHQSLGLVVADGQVYVLGRDQITRLRDLDGDGEADFYECFSNRHQTSPAGHDFVSGLQRDSAGRFYTASSKQGLLRVAADGQSIETIANGFRNPDGLGLTPDGIATVPNSEGEWTPASMICEIRPGGFYGYGGPRNDQPPDLPLVYLPRGIDNSSAAQVFVSGDRFGPLRGHSLHLSFGAGSYFLLLREVVDGQPQGAVVPLPGEFQSGVHRGRFNPADGQLYVTGMAGWGTYTSADGCFQRVRYTGEPVQVPLEFHAHENGVLVTFSEPLDRELASKAERQFAQIWNYRYSAGYGSPELSTRHPNLPGHDRLAIRSAHVLADGRTLFLELPDLQPVNQLHLYLNVNSGPPAELFATVHRLAAPFTGFSGYKPTTKTIAAHPILADMAAAKFKPEPNPWRNKISGARVVTIEAGKNLSYSKRSFTVRAGEAVQLTFVNPDVVPHNWALVRRGSLAKVGDLVNKIVAEPDAAIRNYIPRSDDVLAYTDIVGPQEQFTISFRAPSERGRYPYLCTFPGHWMAMNGEMLVD